MHSQTILSVAILAHVWWTESGMSAGLTGFIESQLIHIASSKGFSIDGAIYVPRWVLTWTFRGCWRSRTVSWIIRSSEIEKKKNKEAYSLDVLAKDAIDAWTRGKTGVVVGGRGHGLRQDRRRNGTNRQSVNRQSAKPISYWSRPPTKHSCKDGLHTCTYKSLQTCMSIQLFRLTTLPTLPAVEAFASGQVVLSKETDLHTQLPILPRSPEEASVARPKGRSLSSTVLSNGRLLSPRSRLGLSRLLLALLRLLLALLRLSFFAFQLDSALRKLFASILSITTMAAARRVVLELTAYVSFPEQYARLHRGLPNKNGSCHHHSQLPLGKPRFLLRWV